MKWMHRRLSKGVESLVEASAAEAEAISAAFERARQSNGRLEQSEHYDDEAADTSGLPKLPTTLNKVQPTPMEHLSTPVDVRLHHRAVSSGTSAFGNVLPLRS